MKGFGLSGPEANRFVVQGVLFLLAVLGLRHGGRNRRSSGGGL